MSYISFDLSSIEFPILLKQVPQYLFRLHGYMIPRVSGNSIYEVLTLMGYLTKTTLKPYKPTVKGSKFLSYVSLKDGKKALAVSDLEAFREIEYVIMDELKKNPDLKDYWI
jgi:hypothetical protein